MSDSVEFVEFFGEQFAAPQRINQRLLIKVSRLAAEGADTEDMDEAKAKAAAIVLDQMIEQCVRAEDKQRFEDICDRERVNDEELMEFVGKVMEVVSGRPTTRPSVSSAGQTVTEPSSGDASFLRVVERLETSGRPELAYMVEETQKARSAV